MILIRHKPAAIELHVTACATSEESTNAQYYKLKVLKHYACAWFITVVIITYLVQCHLIYLLVIFVKFNFL